MNGALTSVPLQQLATILAMIHQGEASRMPLSTREHLGLAKYTAQINDLCRVCCPFVHTSKQQEQYL